jgi:hypothetical protein
MPEATVYEDYCAPPGEHEIRLARKIFSVQAVSVPKTVGKPTYKHFGLCAAASNARHVGATALWGQFIHSIYVARFPQKVNLLRGCGRKGDELIPGNWSEPDVLDQPAITLSP